MNILPVEKLCNHGEYLLLATILCYPSQEDIKLIIDSIRSFLTNQSGINREVMLFNIRNILDNYHISKYNFVNFSVHACPESDFSYIYAKQKVDHSLCPGCASDIYSPNSPVRILSIVEGVKDRATYGCRCGEIFYRVEKK